MNSRVILRSASISNHIKLLNIGTNAIPKHVTQRLLSHACLSPSPSLLQPLHPLHPHRCTPQQRRHYTKRNILELFRRGLWKDRFPPSCPEFEAALTDPKKPLTLYAGFDPTADSLHIGNLLVLVALIHAQRAGHSPIVLIGGFTAGFSDPSGRTETRRGLGGAAVEANSGPVAATVQRVFANHAACFWADRQATSPLTPPRVVNNRSWLSRMTLEEYLRLGDSVLLSQLTKSAYIKERVESAGALPFSELSYQMLQAIDWLHLYETYGCTLQVGGSDQAGNLWLGRSLLRDRAGVAVTGLTLPLITTESGAKLGKSAGNALWLSPEKTSCFDFYQYFLRRKDSEVENLLKLFTFRPLEEITKIMASHWKEPARQRAQQVLAKDVTRLVHGDAGLQTALACTDVLYRNNAGRLYELEPRDLEALFSDNTLELPLTDDTTVLRAARLAGFFATDDIAATTIKAGGLSVNQVRVTEPHLLLVPGIHVLPCGYSVLRSGKRNFKLVRWT